MPLKICPNEGLELSLGEYTRLRAVHGGSWFWEHDNQKVIRQSLGEFLPRVEERPGGALFQHFVGGKEVTSRSRATGPAGDRIPAGELARLHRALDALKRQAEDPQTDSNARTVIEKFSLPDPTKDPELYRLHGPAWNRRLLVLWGCEREGGTSLAPAAALRKMSVEPASAAWLRRLPLLLVALLLLLLLLFLAGQWFRRPRDPEPLPARPPDPGAALPPGETPIPPNRPAAAGSQPTGALAVPGLPPPGSGPAATNSDASGRPDSTPLPGSSPATPGGNNVTPATLPPPSTGGPSAGVSQPSLPQGGPASPAATNTGAPPAASARRPEPAAGITASPPSVPTPPPPAGTGNEPPRPSAQGGPAPSAASPNANAAASPGQSPSGAKSNPQPEPGPALPSPAKDDPAGRPTPLATPAAAPPKVEIINARSTPAAQGGKMDLLLVATGRGGSGDVQPLTITRWTIAGAPQMDAAGRPLTASQLGLSLPAGRHRVNVSAVSADGVPVEGEVDVEVDVQVKTEGSVKVKPGAKK